MVLPGHLAGGYLATRGVLALAGIAGGSMLANISPEQISALIIAGTIAGELPDMDLFFYYGNQKAVSAAKENASESMDSHRSYITHAPLFWAALSLIIVGVGYLIGSEFAILSGWILLAGTWSHFILDSVEYGIRWLWPFSSKRFNLRESLDPPSTRLKGSISYYYEMLTRYYWKRVTFYLEIIVVLLALWVALL